MHWPKHIRDLILSFRPPWWCDEDLTDLPSLAELDFWHFEDYVNEMCPPESWDLPFYIFGTEKNKSETLRSLELWRMECLEEGKDPRINEIVGII